MMTFVFITACGKTNHNEIFESVFEVYKEDLEDSLTGAMVLKKHDNDYELKENLDVVYWENEGYMRIIVPVTENTDKTMYYKIDGNFINYIENVEDEEAGNLGKPDYHMKKGEVE